MTKAHISCWNTRKLGNTVRKKMAPSFCWKPAVKKGGHRVDKLMQSEALGCHINGEYSMATVQANNSMEDQSQIESGPLSTSNFGPRGTFVGVYDGHDGPEAALFIKEHLFNHVKELMLEHQEMSADVIRKAYAATEADFLCLVDKQWNTKQKMLLVGSCCLVGIICHETLYIASVGDSRVVLGRTRDGSNGTAAIQLLTEHNVSIESERLELQSLHPDDPNIVVYKHGIWRVKGFTQLSRSIGDAYLKDAKFNKELLYANFKVHDFQKSILSPEPSVFSRKLQPQDRYLIFASDGLWEYVSNEEAINIVDSYPRNGIARRLVKAAVQEAAKKREMRYSDILKISSGVRRHFHDDITVIVLFLDTFTPSKSFWRPPR